MLNLSNICENIKLTKVNILAGDTALGKMTLSIMTFSIKNLCALNIRFILPRLAFSHYT